MVEIQHRGGEAEIALRRRSNLELAALALRLDSGSHLRRESLMSRLNL